IDQSELAGMATPVVDKDAAAEAIFWEIAIEDTVGDYGLQANWSHYIRIKGFTPLGGEGQSKGENPYLQGTEVKNIAARTIKPNGQIVELQSNAINDRTLIKASGLKYKAKSFVLPGVEPGSIIEYRWTEKRANAITLSAHLDIQRDL